MEKPVKPKPPPFRIVREDDGGPFCPLCGSSFKLRWLIFKTDKRLQPECDNHCEKEKRA